MRVLVWGALFVCSSVAVADDSLSSQDRLDLMFSSQFQFTSDGQPVVTVELMSGRQSATLGSGLGVLVRPDGDGTATIAGGGDFTISTKNTAPGLLKGWVVVERFPAKRLAAANASEKKWQQRGYQTKQFEIGTMFAVSGAIVDNRQLLIAVAPGPIASVEQRQRKVAKRWKVPATTYTELVRKPSGTIVARSGNIAIENASMIWFYPKHGTIWVDNIEVGGGGSQLKTNFARRSYHGAVYATIGIDGKLTLVNAVGAETMLEGLVPAEIYPEAPYAALRAQAIAARTELLQKLGMRHQHKPFLLCSTQQCQVYAGAGSETKRTSRAVKSTRGMTLVAKDKLVDARYSAACGGHTEDKDAIWGGAKDPVLSGKPDKTFGRRGGVYNNVQSFLEKSDGAYCSATRWSKGRFRWTKRVSAQAMAGHLKRHGYSVGAVTSIKPGTRLRSGRAAKVLVVGSRGRVEIAGDLTIRRALGGLRSTLFVVEKVGGDYVFRGGGFGHGVGLCQLGAIGMASKGLDHKSILLHYYTGAKLTKLY